MKIEATLTPELVNGVNELSEGLGEDYINELDKIKNFFICNWDLLSGFDKEIKEFLIQICNMQGTFKGFEQNEE